MAASPSLISSIISSTFSKPQLTDEQLVAAGIDGGLVRFSCGLENVEDIIEDIKLGLAAI